jgi:hypothetical protein
MRLIRYIHRTVTQGDWGVSCSTGHGIKGAILHVYRARFNGRELPYDRWMKGFGDGKNFPTTEAASQWAFDHGYLQLYFAAPDLRARRKAMAAANPALFFPKKATASPVLGLAA